NTALGFPPGYLIRLLAGQPPGAAGTPAAPESLVMARLTQIERKLDELLTLAKTPGAPTAPARKGTVTPVPHPPGRDHVTAWGTPRCGRGGRCTPSSRQGNLCQQSRRPLPPAVVPTPATS